MAGRLPLSDDDSSALLRLYRALGEIVAELGDSRGIADACGSLADYAVRHLEADVAGVFRHPRRGGPDLVAATDPLVADLAALRERHPDLPCGSPLAEGEILMAADSTRADGAAWHPIAALGVRSALIVGLPKLSGGPATIEMYSHRSSVFTAVASEAARLSRLGGFAVRDVERRTNLEDALLTRDVIGQAQGILMERFQLTGEQAMAYLRRRSQQSQQPIREIAGDVVGRRNAESTAVGLGDGPADPA